VRTGEAVDILLGVSSPGTWMAHCHIAEYHESDDVQLRGDGMRLGTQAGNHFRCTQPCALKCARRLLRTRPPTVLAYE
jgi:hypothetical protein